MDNDASFITVLTTIGLRTVAQRQVIIGNGINNLEDLLGFTESDLQDVYKANDSANRMRPNAQVIIPINVRKRIEAIRKELGYRKACGATLDATAIAAIDVAWVTELVEEQREWKESIDDAAELPAVTIPKLTKTNWALVKTAIVEKLSRIRGANGIPLSYVVRPNDENDYDEDYPSLEDKLVNCIRLTGNKYRTDNTQVFSILNEVLDGTVGASFVTGQSTSRRGRQAYKALITHYESEAQNTQRRNAGYDAIRKARYSGPKKKFTLRDYHVLHVNAHALIDKADEDDGKAVKSLTDSAKIQLFQDGIECEKALEHSTLAIRSFARDGVTPTFEQYYQEMSAIILSVSDLSSRQGRATGPFPTGTNRNITPVNTNDPPSGRSGGRGRGRGGRGRGRFGRGGRGGRGREGRGSGRGYHPYQRWQPRLGEYTDEEWYSLSNEQKASVHALRNAMRNQSGLGNDPPQPPRTINQIQQDDGTIASTGTGLPPPPPPPPPPAPPAQGPPSVQGSQGTMGNSFGNRSYQS